MKHSALAFCYQVNGSYVVVQSTFQIGTIRRVNGFYKYYQENYNWALGEEELKQILEKVSSLNEEFLMESYNY